MRWPRDQSEAGFCPQPTFQARRRGSLASSGRPADQRRETLPSGSATNSPTQVTRWGWQRGQKRPGQTLRRAPQEVKNSKPFSGGRTPGKWTSAGTPENAPIADTAKVTAGLAFTPTASQQEWQPLGQPGGVWGLLETNTGGLQRSACSASTLPKRRGICWPRSSPFTHQGQVLGTAPPSQVLQPLTPVRCLLVPFHTRSRVRGAEKARGSASGRSGPQRTQAAGSLPGTLQLHNHRWFARPRLHLRR